ncbi:MAG: glutamyl-tRNA reductase [Rhodospirillales bacterium]|nr:glutamyl-tRNA reductase [Rhodospirillales bacterium]
MAEGRDLGGYVLVGANHRSAPLSERDLMFVEDAHQPVFLAELREVGFPQALALATCDRVEILAVDADPAQAKHRLLDCLARRAGLDSARLAPSTYALEGVAAVRHVFAVAAALDSQTVGEPQVLGQVKAAHRFARDAGQSGPELEALMQAAFAGAKRVRAETAIGERPVSMAAAAVQMARDLHGDLARRDGLMLGDGDMGALVAETLLSAGLRRLIVACPRPSRAEQMARALNCHAAPFVERDDLLAQADIVITALSGTQAVVAADTVQAALRRRRRRPIFLVDAGLPGDIEPAVDRVEGAFLYDLDDLEQVAMAGRASREAASNSAWAIVDEEVAAFARGRAERAAVPAIVALRRRFEHERERALAEAGADATRATWLMMNRLLHDPSEALKVSAGHAGIDWSAEERLLRRLFRLDEDES